MSDSPKRPNFLISTITLFGVIMAGAYISSVPLFLVKVAGATLLVFVYAYCGSRIVESFAIGSAGARKALGLILGVGCVYLTWVIRLPVFSGWETALTFNPSSILGGIEERAGSMQMSGGFGNGTTTEGPSWLLLGTYIVEALAITLMMYLAAWLSAPDNKKDNEEEVAPNAVEAS